MERIKVAVNLNALGVGVQMASVSTTGGTVNVSNSDDTYFVSVSVPNSHELPNVTHIDPFGNNVVTPAQNVFDSTNFKTGIAYDRPPVSSDASQVELYDIGYHITQGTYIYLPPVYPVSFARKDYLSASPFLTLVDNNKHGNKSRFTDTTGVQTYSVLVVEDNESGLMWSKSVQSAVSWLSALTAANASNLGGFNNWRVPTINEYLTIVRENLPGGGLNYAPFSVAVSGVEMWTNETSPLASGTAYTVFPNLSIAELVLNTNREAKTSLLKYMLVRNNS